MSIEDGELCQANSGALRFQVQSLSGFAYLALCSINPPHKELFKIFLARNSRIENVQQANNNTHESVRTEFIDFTMQHQEFWMTWFNEEIHVGFNDQTNPFMSCKYVRSDGDMIGFVKFNKKHFTGLTRSDHITDWIYEVPPVLYPREPNHIKSGALRWVTLTGHHLPADALIGGFEKEPIYIARAEHNGSLCPGKYVPSQRLAFVPWGGREHPKAEFEILCGYNAIWKQTSGNRIPQNAFIGGISEVREEPLYIGRAVHDGNLINGKIHVIYHTCYLPYKGAEVEVYSFEILVLPEDNYRGTLADADCEI